MGNSFQKGEAEQKLAEIETDFAYTQVSANMRPSHRIEEIKDREKWRQEAMDELRAEIKQREENLALVQEHFDEFFPPPPAEPEIDEDGWERKLDEESGAYYYYNH